MAPLFLHVFSTLAVGGSQVRTADLVTAFGPRIEHLLVAADGRFDALDRLNFAAPCERLDGPFAKSRGVSLANLRRIWRTIHERQPSLLLTYNFGSLEAALANRLHGRIPHLHFEDGFGPDESPAHQLPRRVWLRRIALANTDRLVVPSRTLERLAIETWRLPRDRVLYLPNGIDLDRFATAKPVDRSSLGAQPGDILVGAIGALRPEKNLHRLLRVVAEARRRGALLRLVLVGDGSEADALRQAVEALGLQPHVHFTGHVGRPEGILQALDIVALSSDTEQMPYSVVEAMAAAKPVVATAVGDVADMLAETADPWTVPLGQEGAFAENLVRLAADPALRGRLGETNQARAKRQFGLERMVERYLKLFNTTIRDGRHIGDAT